jgi:hypothetical protein
MFSFFEDLAFLKLLMAELDPFDFFGPGNPDACGKDYCMGPCMPAQAGF